MQQTEINGAQLTYEVVGSGVPAIFLHGFLASGTGAYYADFKTRLAASYRLYVLDMRSHGGSAQVSHKVTLDQYTRDVAAFADALDLDCPLLVGHSMGGFVSMGAAMLHPKRFKALALVTPAASKGRLNSEAQVADFMAARANREAMDQRFAAMFVRAPDRTKLDTLRQAALCLSDDVAERWMRSEWPNSDLTGGLSSIHAPVLSVIGSKDVVVSPQHQYDDALQMPHAKVVTFTDEGHMFPLEQPERCADEVLRFFGDMA